MANGEGKDGVLGPVLGVLFGERSRFVILGVALALLYKGAMDFKREMMLESQAVRHSLAEYVAANEKWQALSAEERARLIAKADARFRRLYAKNGWEYQGITE